MKLTINGQEVEAREGQSVLDAALDAGIFIPHLCKHPDLEAVGGCRLCMVEVDGAEEPVCACKTQVREGMQVNVNGERADRVRRMAMELILATHPTDCTGCPKYGTCELQSMYQYMGVSPTRWRVKSRPVATDESNPLITHMFTRCIRCGRCVRACRELRGVGVLDYQHTEEGIRIGTDGSRSRSRRRAAASAARALRSAPRARSSTCSPAPMTTHPRGQRRALPLGLPGASSDIPRYLPPRARRRVGGRHGRRAREGPVPRRPSAPSATTTARASASATT